MFPEILSTDLFSLNENKIRHAINFLFEINLEKKEIINFEIVLEPIYIKKNDTYEHCNRILNTKIAELEYLETLKCLEELLPFIKKFYSIDKLYAKMKRTEANTTLTNIIGSTTSEKIIEALMIFTNLTYAKYASELEIPILYRNHEMFPFYKEKLMNYEKMMSEEKNQIYKNEINILKSKYPSSYYGILNQGHYGLGIPYYTHITSPDRRVADCMNILMLQKYLNNTLKLKEEKEKLKNIACFINERNRSMNSYVKEITLSVNRTVK